MLCRTNPNQIAVKGSGLIELKKGAHDIRLHYYKADLYIPFDNFIVGPAHRRRQTDPMPGTAGAFEVRWRRNGAAGATQGCTFQNQTCADFERLNEKGFTKRFMFDFKAKKSAFNVKHTGNYGMKLAVFDKLVATKCCGVPFVPVPADALSHTATVRDTKVPYTYTPPANAFGSVKLGYELSDSKGNLCKSFVAASISPVNDAPVAKPDTFDLDASRAKLKPNGVDCSKGSAKACVGLFTKVAVKTTALLGNDVDVDGKQLRVLNVAGKPIHGKLEPLPSDNKQQLAFIYVPTTGYRPNMDAYYLVEDRLKYTIADDKPAEDTGNGAIVLIVRKPLTACVAGESYETAKPTLASDRVCAPCSICPRSKPSQGVCKGSACIAAGTFIKSKCTATADRTCTPLTSCDMSKQFESPAAKAGSDNFNSGQFVVDRKCANLTSCSSTDYQSVANTGSSDRKCAKATVCKSSEYEAKDRTATSDRVCKTISTCQLGTFVFKAAAKTTDKECRPCPANKYADGTDAQACKDQPQCGAGQLISADSAKVLRKCGACPTETFQTKTEHRDTTCVDIASCPAGTAIDKESTSKSDRTCAKCDGSKEYQDTADQKNCATMTVCGPGTAIKVDGTPKSDRRCEKCAQGKTFQDKALQAKCKPIAQCRTGEGETTKPTLSSDRKCQDCKTGTYQDEAEELVCKSVTECKAGAQEKTAQTTKADRTCEPCKAGTFQPDGTGTHKCKAVAQCKAGQEQDKAPTKSSDRTCQTCTTNTFQDKDNQDQCKRATVCQAGSRIKQEHTPSADRTCAVCDGTNTWQDATNQKRSSSCGSARQARKPGSKERQRATESALPALSPRRSRTRKARLNASP